jgi:transglutaminase-like putative cysteine protease
VWLHVEGRCEVTYTTRAAIDRILPDIATLARLEPHDLPAEAVQYLFDSRYCPADRFQPFVEAEFGGTSGGARVAAIRDWIAANMAYVPGSSDSNTTALDSFVERRGICRDFAHVLITLAARLGDPGALLQRPTRRGSIRPTSTLSRRCSWPIRPCRAAAPGTSSTQPGWPSRATP